MILSELLNNIHVIQVIGKPELVEVKHLTLDSRDAGNKSIFIAIQGFKLDGHKFIAQAVSNMVAAVVMDKNDAEIDHLLKTNNVVKILVKDSRKALAKIADLFYGSPSKKLNLIGITGTKGKTTTSYYIKNILDSDERLSGVIGTNKNIIGDREIPSKLTTPEAHVINEYLSQMVNKNCSDCVMEVSSHSLVLSRVEELDFNVGVFTNITSDHLDFHSSFENYLAAKKIFFDNMKSDSVIIYNADDPNSEKLLHNCAAKKISYALNSEADLRIKDVKFDLNGTKFHLEYKENTYEVSTKLIGLFNAYNSTASIGAAIYSDINIDDAVNGIASTPQVPGRFEVLGNENKKVIIDYSHTADSLKQALMSIRHIVNKTQPVYTVFGCGGDRDKTKRPVMGSIAEEYSDYTYITSDNPRTEDPYQIIKEIEHGMKTKSYKIIEDRELAIKSAIEQSEDNAVILIAGKGHETYQEINGVRNHFSDKEIAERYL